MDDVTVVPAGYRITVTSWENDCDNENTKTLEGLTLEQTKLLTSLCLLMESHHSSKGMFGNMYEPSAKQLEAFGKACQEVFKKYSPVTAFPDWELEQSVVDDTDRCRDIAVDLLYDVGLTGGEQYSRVLDKLKVEYLPEEIHIQDVTKQFDPHA